MNWSGIWIRKSKFFLFRAVTYSSFLLIPVFIQKSLNLGQALQALMMLFYILFMAGQWFMLGKEIDHRLRIYFRVNSSIDRIIYRFLLGMMFFVLYFNLLSFFPDKWTNNLFWTTWVILGLFYSWPTRGKIIRESITTNFSEFRYLDSFEKTLVGLIIILFIFSVPELPSLINNEALKLFFDPLEKFSGQYWSFLRVNYFPFVKYPALFKIAWCMHFYIVGMGLFLITLYAVLRYIVSRRLALLGVFALLSSWSFSKILGSNYGATIFTTFSLTWVWTILWVAKSSSYRAGLFLGLIGYLGTIIDQSFAFLLFIQLLLLYFFFLKKKTRWFRKKVLKYSILGVCLTIFTLALNLDVFDNLQPINKYYLSSILTVGGRKAFFSLSIFGLIILALKIKLPNITMIRNIQFDMEKIYQLLISVGILFIYSIFFDSYLVKHFSLMWPIVVLSLIPLEFLFQTMSRLRSSRNMIYLIYILICLLDSHFEGRVKIFLRLFQ